LLLLLSSASPLSEAPITPPPGVEPVVELTGEPVLGEEQDKEPPAEDKEEKRKRKEKKQIIDDVTELQNGRGRGGLGPAMSKDVSAILTEHHYLPRSPLVMRLLEIREDPITHFFPTRVTPRGTFFCAAPPGMAPELQEMFLRPMQPASTKRRGTSPEKPPSKRARIAESVVGDEEVEQARRAASVAPSIALGSDVLGHASVGPGMESALEFDNAGLGMDDFQMDVGGDMAMHEADVALERARSKSIAPSELTRLSATPAPEEGEETYADLECPIAIFDMKGSSQTSESETASVDSKGYSKNTVQALGIIRKELQPAEDEVQEKMMSFKRMTEKVVCFLFI